eukprot:GHVT01023418.1.p2 GENE.GHVT01023418.1~~GHVT01023418.1.p2  ORF type:complete len:524 (+),score=68.04 GHVT01023418.1:2554-4125(+)
MNQKSNSPPLTASLFRYDYDLSVERDHYGTLIAPPTSARRVKVNKEISDKLQSKIEDENRTIAEFITSAATGVPAGQKDFEECLGSPGNACSGTVYSAADRIAFKLDKSGPAVQFTMRRSTAAAHGGPAIDWHKFKSLIVDKLPKSTTPLEVFVDLEHGLYVVDKTFAGSLAALDSANALGWRLPAAKSTAPSAGEGKKPQVTLDDFPHTLSDIAIRLHRRGLENFTIDGSIPYNLKIKWGEKEFELGDVNPQVFSAWLAGLEPKKLVLFWQDNKLEKFAKNLPKPYPLPGAVEPTEQTTPNPSRPSTDKVVTVQTPKPSRPSTDKVVTVQTPKPSSSSPKILAGIDARESGMTNEKAVGDDSQKTEKFTFSKPHILVPALLAGVAGIGTLCGVSAYFLRKKAKKSTKPQTKVERKSDATVPVSFARGRKAKASLRPKSKNLISKPRQKNSNPFAVQFYPEAQSEKPTMYGAPVNPETTNNSFAMTVSVNPETAYENSTVYADSVNPLTTNNSYTGSATALTQ